MVFGCWKPLRRVLSKKGLQHLIAENLENFLSAQMQSYLKKVKNQVSSSHLVLLFLLMNNDLVLTGGVI